MTKRYFAIGAALALAFSATVAQAAQCPNPSAGGRVFTIDAPVQNIGGPASNNECYDYGLGNPGQGGPGAVTYGTDTGTKEGTGLGGITVYNDAVASVPLGFKLLDATDADGSMPGLLSVTGLNGNSGTLTIGLPSLEGYMVLFKSGQGLFNPDWASFVLTAGSFGTFDWLIQPAQAGGLSHVELWGKTVVPIPAAAWLLGSGLLGLFAVGRRRKAAEVVAA